MFANFAVGNNKNDDIKIVVISIPNHFQIVNKIVDGCQNNAPSLQAKENILKVWQRERPLERNVVEKLGAIVRWREHTPLLCVDKITAAGDFFRYH